MVGRRIGSAIIRSRKTKIVCARVYFWRRFSPFLGNSRADDHPLTKKPVEGNDTYLNPGRKVRTAHSFCTAVKWLSESKKKSGNGCFCKSATRLVRFAGTNVLKMSGRGFGWGNGHGLVGCDWISHHIPIAFSYPEILHAIRVSTNTVLIQSLMHSYSEIVLC